MSGEQSLLEWLRWMALMGVDNEVVMLQGGALERCAEAAVEIERLRAVLSAIDALHQPQEGLDEYLRSEPWCPACANPYPCPTARLLHPEAGPS